MNFDPEPYIHACHILDPDDRLWFYRPPPIQIQVLPCPLPQETPPSPPKPKRTVKNLKQYHKVTNAVLKNIVLDLKFQNDALRLFIFQCQDGGNVDLETHPFLKLVLMVRSLGITESKLGSRPHSTSGKRSRTNTMLHAVRIISERLLVLFEKYHQKKLCLESAWSIQEAVAEFRNSRALEFFRTVQQALDGTATHQSGHLYWLMLRWQKKLTSDVIMMEMVVKEEGRKLREWWLAARRLQGFKETLPCPPEDRYIQLLEMVRLLDIKRRAATARMDSIAPHLDILQLQNYLIKSKEREAKECRKCLQGMYK